jgi:hypothetical protein
MSRDGQTDQAVEMGREVLQRRPSLPVAVKVAELLAGSGKAKARTVPSVLAFVGQLAAIKPSDVPVALEGAEILEKTGEAKAALAIYERLLQTPTLAPDMRLRVLAAGRKTAEAAHETALLRQWADETTRLTKRGGS